MLRRSALSLSISLVSMPRSANSRSHIACGLSSGAMGWFEPAYDIRDHTVAPPVCTPNSSERYGVSPPTAFAISWSIEIPPAQPAVPPSPPWNSPLSSSVFPVHMQPMPIWCPSPGPLRITRRPSSMIMRSW